MYKGTRDDIVILLGRRQRITAWERGVGSKGDVPKGLEKGAPFYLVSSTSPRLPSWPASRFSSRCCFGYPSAMDAPDRAFRPACWCKWEHVDNDRPVDRECGISFDRCSTTHPRRELENACFVLVLSTRPSNLPSANNHSY